MEPTDEFERRALGLAGPVLFFFLGVVLLLVVLVATMVAGIPPMVAGLLLLFGLLTIGFAMAWGLRVGGRSARRG